MALIHQNATLNPGKLDLLATWLPGRSWYPAGATGELRKLGTFRFDDPAGEVGIETFLLGVGESVLQVPLTYRGAPLVGAQEHLVGTMEHSVLGPRWVYDGAADPVWVAALAQAALTGGVQADHLVEVDGAWQTVATGTTARGSGTPGTPVGTVDASPIEVVDGERVTTVRAGALEIALARVVGTDVTRDGAATLTAAWPDGGPAVVAAVTG